MNISDIQKLADKTPIDRVEAVVKKVYPPKQATPAQAKAGIKVQTLLLSDGTGEINARIIKEVKHIGRDAEGETYVFMAAKADNGQPDGIASNAYTKEGKTTVSIDMNGHVQIWKVLPHTKGEPEQEPDIVQPVREPDPDMDTTRTEPAKEQGSLAWLENYMAFYRAGYDVVARHMAGTGISPDGAKEILTSKLIGDSGKGKLDGHIAAFLKSPEAQPEPDWQTVTTKDGRVIGEMDKDTLADFAATVLPHLASKDARVKTICDATLCAIAHSELTYAEIYDRWDVKLAEKYDTNAIANAYQKIEASMGGEQEATCVKIMQNPTVYVKLIEGRTT